MTDFQIGPTGIWLCQDASPHTFDKPLADAVCDFLIKRGASEVLDVGCGSGAYVNHLRHGGIRAIGIDGNPATPSFCEGCQVVDLTTSFSDFRSEWVLCLEVGEHIPQNYELKFLSELSVTATRGVILSWFPYDGEGIGHVNPKPNEHIKRHMKWFGLEFNEEATNILRGASIQWWFKKSLMVFERL